MMRTLYMGKGGGGVDRVVAGDAEPGAVGAGDVEGMVSVFPAVDAFQGAVTGTMLAVAIGLATVGGMFCGGVGFTTEVAAYCVSL
jgi:hypothetical protein